MIKRYDIVFLDDYLKLKNISRPVIAEKIGLAYGTLYNAFKGTVQIREEKLNILLDIFNVKSYEELQELVKNDHTTSLDNINLDTIEKYDISFLSEYLDKHKIDKEDITLLLDASDKTFDQILLGKKLISDKMLKEVTNYFNVTTYDELKELMNNYKQEVKEKEKENNIKLRNNIKYRYSYLKIDDEIYDKAIAFAKENNLELENPDIKKILDKYSDVSERIFRYIEYYVLINSKNNDIFYNYIISMIETRSIVKIRQYKISQKEIHDHIDKILDVLINNYDLEHDLIKNIKRNIEEYFNGLNLEKKKK